MHPSPSERFRAKRTSDATNVSAMGSTPVSFRRDKSTRLRKRFEFTAARKGRQVHTPHFRVLVSRAPVLRASNSTTSTGATSVGTNTPASTRLGITITKRCCPLAVDRNRAKRVVREVFRLNREFFPVADIVVLGKNGVEQLSYQQAREEFRRVQRPLAKAAARVMGNDS